MISQNALCATSCENVDRNVLGNLEHMCKKFVFDSKTGPHDVKVCSKALALNR
jgi:hypothetical protein